jgi:hypothetical protein
MDKRCPRNLKQPPQHFCPLAVARLRWRDAVKDDPRHKRELSEPKDAPGCPWAVRSHEHGYCFFALNQSPNAPEKFTDSQIAHLEGIPEAAVKKIADKAIKKSAQMKVFKEIRETHKDGPLVIERPIDGYEDQLNDISGISISSDGESEVKSESDF